MATVTIHEVFFGPMSDDDVVEMFGQEYFDLVNTPAKDDN
jgi:hypothetical protein